jgi:histidine phosphotransferase ChpT
MSENARLDALELSALVSSKICHDIISPVGAIANGLEILAEESDESMREHAMSLVRKSATTASVKLQFARLAFGAAGSAGAEIDLLDAERVARAVVESDRHTLEWNGPAATLSKDKVKLLLNLTTIALETLPRGGQIKVGIEGVPDNPVFELLCTGEKSRIPDEIGGLLNGRAEEIRLDAHSIQPYYTIRLAEASGMPLTISADGDVIRIRAESAG